MEKKIPLLKFALLFIIEELIFMPLKCVLLNFTSVVHLVCFFIFKSIYFLCVSLMYVNIPGDQMMYHQIWNRVTGGCETSVLSKNSVS